MSRIAKDLDGGAHNSHGGHPNNSRRPSRPKGKTPHVAVVGAGLAGLRCADLLLQSGVHVTVFEARDRIGGRVHQVNSGGHLVDLGPNWVHGNTDANPIHSLARRTKTVLHEWEDEQTIVDSTGKPMAPADVDKYSSIVWQIVANAYKYSDQHSDIIDPSKSLMDYFRQEVPKRESDPLRGAEIMRLAQSWGAFVGDPIEKQSLKFFFLEETIEGENAFVASTYKAILDQVGANVMKSIVVQLNTEIKQILASKYTPKDALGSKPTPTLQTIHGKWHTFDEIVVTAPLGWLKAHRETAFHHPLPKKLSQAIDNTNYGRLEKCYITFNTPFWGANYPGFTHFQSPDYVSHPPDHSWNQECVNLAALSGDTAHPTLLFYVFGPCATQLVQTITGLKPASEAYNAALDHFFRPFYSKLPNYDSDNPNCTPTAFLATQWQNDKFAGHGSYTNFQVGLERGDRDIEVMREGLPDRGLWFAGEHTAPFIALGTTTGAYWSGEGVARRICRLYGIDVPVEDTFADSGGKDVEASEPDAAQMNGLAL